MASAETKRREKKIAHLERWLHGKCISCPESTLLIAVVIYAVEEALLSNNEKTKRDAEKFLRQPAIYPLDVLRISDYHEVISAVLDV